MSKAKITDKEYRRFEDIIYKLWYVFEFGQDKHINLSNRELTRIKDSLTRLKAERPREADILIRHRLKRVYYTAIAREQDVSEGYIRKLAKNGAYYFLQLYDDWQPKD